MAAQADSALTFEEHKHLSRELIKTQRRMVELRNLVADVYGAETHASYAFTIAADAIGKLRHALQTQAAEDCPGMRADDLYR